MLRRTFIKETCLAMAAGTALAGCRQGNADVPSQGRGGDAPGDRAEGRSAPLTDWETVRAQFVLNPDRIHLSSLFIASNPEPVRAAIDRYRRALDEDPVATLLAENGPRRGLALKAAAEYLDAEAGEIALTESTTMGLGLVYNGLRLGPGDEVLTTEHDYYVTHESLRLSCLRSGASLRKVALHPAGRPEAASADAMVEAVAGALRPETRVLAVTWVHSGSGLKLPLARIGKAVAAANAGRPEAERILFCVDGVHGFGVEDTGVAEMGCDFFVSGCHKWLFGPRGTGLVWGSPRAWRSSLPTIPSFIDGEAWEAWRDGEVPDGETTAARMSPGGFKAFEHQWALPEAFAFHSRIGRSRIAERTHALNGQLVEGLAATKGVRLHTPRDGSLRAGIACFSVEGMDPFEAAGRLNRRGVVATVTPYAQRYVRFAPSIRNLPSEIDKALAAVRELA
jgi:selenocysteine lyase/cysteine desulfurase